ncbi:hypothetical protein [Muninn virus]|nr:hypothetical protein [Muninn virus]
MSEEKNYNICGICGFPIYGGDWNQHPECRTMVSDLNVLAEDIIRGLLPHHKAIVNYLITHGWHKDTLKCILMAKVDKFYEKVCSLVAESRFSPKWRPEFLVAVELYLFHTE